MHEPGGRLCSWTALCSRAPLGVSPDHSSLEHTAPSLSVVRGNRPHLIGECIPFFLIFKTSKSSPNGSSPHQSPVVPEGTGTCFLKRTGGWACGASERTHGGFGRRGTGRPRGACTAKRRLGQQARERGKESRPGESADSGDLGRVLLPCAAAAAAATSGSEEEKRLPRWSPCPSVTSAGTGPGCAARGPSLRAPSR